jgi:hypothetical protein
MKTLRELAQEAGIDEKYFDEKGLHLTDVMSWASFSPRTIGRKSNATAKGLQFQLGQYKVWMKQIGQKVG